MVDRVRFQSAVANPDSGLLGFSSTHDVHVCLLRISEAMVTPRMTCTPRLPACERIFRSDMDANRSNNDPERSEYSSTNHHGSQYQFDWLNWFYWNMWWQQYSYWTWSQQQQAASSSTNQTAAGASPQGTPNQFYQYNPLYYPAAGPTWPANYQGQHPQPEGGVAQTHLPGNFLTLQIRIINGFETYVAAPWKRLVAEVIDTVLFVLLLKAYLPEADLRIPEILLEGSDVWATIDEAEDLEEIQSVLQTFVFSVMMQRINHVLMEFMWTAVFSRTPGKWLLGLSIVNAHSIHFTRTQPGYTIRVVPGGRISTWRALVRSVFKSTFSLFCPLVIFFFTLYRGQTKYDRVFQCSVVDSRSLFRPVHAGQGQGSNQPRLVHVG